MTLSIGEAKLFSPPKNSSGLIIDAFYYEELRN